MTRPLKSENNRKKLPGVSNAHKFKFPLSISNCASPCEIFRVIGWVSKPERKKPGLLSKRFRIKLLPTPFFPNIITFFAGDAILYDAYIYAKRFKFYNSKLTK